jgi:hypothetical protein
MDIFIIDKNILISIDKMERSKQVGDVAVSYSYHRLFRRLMNEIVGFFYHLGRNYGVDTWIIYQKVHFLVEI